MSNVPVDPIDALEPRLAGQVRAWAEQAVVPIDAASVARAATTGGRRRRWVWLDGRSVRDLPRDGGWSHGWGRGGVFPIVLATALLVVALVVAVLLVGGNSPMPAPDADLIAFARADYDPTREERPLDLAIFSVPSEGGEPTRLVDVPGNVPWPVWGLVGPVVRWSPDGSQIAFRLFNDESGIWLMDRDGSDLHQLVDLPLDDGPQTPFLEAIDWSPDGTRIAYTYPYDGSHSPLYVVDVEDGRVTSLTGDDTRQGATRALAWSPDGSRIAFARTGGAGRLSGQIDGLFVIDAAGAEAVRLADSDLLNGNIRGLTWAPDGERIAFIWQSYPASGDPVATLKVIDADGGRLRDLTQLHVGGGCCFFEATDLRPLVWLPDGDRIALVRNLWLDQPEGEPETIVLVSADGSGDTELTKGSFFDLSPDGSRLVVAEARLDEDPGPYSIYVMDIDGTEKTWLAEGEFPAWSPGGG